MLNSGLQVGSFYDLRTEFLEDQVADVVRNPHEMKGDLDRAAERIGGDPRYREVLRAVASGGAPLGVGTEGGPTPTGDGVRRALAAYLRSLVALDSRFDRYVRGEGVALSDAERRGFNLFMGRAGCGTCHFAPLFNGSVPPAYRKTEVEILGVPESPDADPLRLDPDPGRAAVYGIELYRHAFKTTTVRNVELTAPYMHDGAYRTLDEVVRCYDAGGGVGLGLEAEHPTLPPDSLHLTDRDVADLVDFLKALTDRTGVSARPDAAEAADRITRR